MTTTITEEQAIIYINNPEGELDIAWDFQLKSQYSQDIVATVAAGDWYIDTQNSRYAQFTVDLPPGFEDKHANGFYTWTLGPYSDIIKLITVPGGDLGEVEYISNNEQRDAEVYYRPEY